MCPVPHRILVIRLSSIGDIVLATPIVRCLRKALPKAKIDFLVKREFLDLVRFSPHLNHIYAFDKASGPTGLAAIRKEIQRVGYDVIVDIHKNFRSLYVRSGSGMAKVAVYRKQLLLRALLVLFKLNLYRRPKPAYLRYFEAVEKFGVHYDGEGTEVFIPKEEIDGIDRLLKTKGYSDSRPLLIVCPGAGFSNKRWLPERFAAVSAYFLNVKAYAVALLGGSEDREICEYIRQQVCGDAMNFAGRLRLIQSAALLQRASVVLANDSGMMHLAQSQKRSVVAVFGPTTEELGYYPIKERSRVVDVALKCKPCTSKGLHRCPKKHFKCMANIGSDQVIAAIESLSP